MNSIGLFAQNPGFRLNGSTSISSYGASIALIIILLLSFFICYPFINDIWAEYQDLYVQYSTIDQGNQISKDLTIAIVSNQTSTIKLFDGTSFLSHASCDNLMNATCFKIPQNTFQNEIVYDIQIPTNVANFEIFVQTQKLMDSNHLSEKSFFKISMNYSQITKIILQKELVVVDSSLLQFETYTVSQKQSLLSYTLENSPSPKVSFLWQHNSIPMFTFKRQKLSLILGKLLTCVQLFYLFFSIFMLTPFHKIKFKYQAAKQTISDPILNGNQFSTSKLISLTLFCNLPYWLQNHLSSFFSEDVVYLCTFTIPLFDKRLSIDKLPANFKQSEEDKQLKKVFCYKKSQKRMFRYNLILDNNLDDQEKDEQQILRRLSLAKKELKRVNKDASLDIWYYLNRFDMSGTPVQFEYISKESEPSDQQIQKTQQSIQQPEDSIKKTKRCLNKKSQHILMGVGILGALFVLFFLNDILEYTRYSRQIDTYTSILQQESVEIQNILFISDSHFQIEVEIQQEITSSNGDLLCSLITTGTPTKYSCSFVVRSKSYQFLNVLMRLQSSSTVKMYLNTSRLLYQQITNKTFQYTLLDGKQTQIQLGIITQKIGLSQRRTISYPTKITQLPILNTGRMQLIFNIDGFQRVRKITYNSFYTIIKSSWTIIRLIIVTMVFEMIIYPIMKSNSTNEFIKQSKNQSEDSKQQRTQSMLDIAALLNFINTNIGKEKKNAKSLDDSLFQIEGCINQ